MDDMWMLSVAAELINRGPGANSASVSLEAMVRAVPALAAALDEARAGEDKLALGEALAAGLGAAYEESEEFAEQLDTLWPQVLFGPRAIAPGTHNTIIGSTGRVIQAGTIAGGITLGSEPKPEPVAAPTPAARDFPSCATRTASRPTSARPRPRPGRRRATR
jgi:hypothetical protein